MINLRCAKSKTKLCNSAVCSYRGIDKTELGFPSKYKIRNSEILDIFYEF
mgnify:CR=1 FL=1